jgi:hypothetical protein
MELDITGEVRPRDTHTAPTNLRSPLAITAAPQSRGQRPITQLVGTLPISGLYHVDGLCGSQKTLTCAKVVAAALMQGESFIFAGPTAIQCQGFVAMLEAAMFDELMRLYPEKERFNRVRAGSCVRLINTEELRDDEQHRTVRERLADAIRETRTSKIGLCFVITHATLLHTRPPRNMHLVLDEDGKPVLAQEVTLPNVIWRGFEFAPDARDQNRLRLSPTWLAGKIASARKQADKAKDSGDHKVAAEIRNKLVNPLRELLRKIEGGLWRTSVEPAKLNGRKLRLSSGNTSQIALRHVLNFDAFLGAAAPKWKSVTLMAACYDQTWMAMELARQGRVSTPHPVITPALAFGPTYPHSETVTIYFASSRDGSKKLRDTTVNGRSVAEHIREYVEEMWKGQPFGWAANNDLPDGFLSGTRLPFTSHGLNSFTHLSRICVLSLPIPKPEQERALAGLGYTREQIRDALANENCHQTCMRSMQRLNKGAKVEYVVFDEGMARYMQKLMPNATLKPLGIAEPEKEKNGRPRTTSLSIETHIELFVEKLISDTRTTPNWFVKVYDKEAQKYPNDTASLNSFDDLVDLLRTAMGRNPVAEKTDNSLIYQGTHRASDELDKWGKPTAKARSNVEGRSSLWLDFETQGDGASGMPIPWWSFAKMPFLVGVRMCAYSSFNHSPTKIGTRYRVVIELSHAVGPEIYETLFNLIRLKLEEQRWLTWREGDQRKGVFHGLDLSKVSATSQFWLPIKRLGNEKAAWFEDIGSEPLKVEEWLTDPLINKLVPAMPEPFTTPVMATAIDTLLAEAKVQAAFTEYQTSPASSDKKLNRLGLQLAGYGCPTDFIQAELTNLAKNASDPAKRLSQIPHIIKYIYARRCL